MHNLYLKIELLFEKLTSCATAILGNAITFIIALCLVLFWLGNKMFYKHSIDDSIPDIILSFTFLSLFIIQKSFNRFSAIIHVKVNELVSSTESASNSVLNLEMKTKHEISEMNREYEHLIITLEENERL